MKTKWTAEDAAFHVQDLVFARHGEPDFRSKGFHCYSGLPVAWRMPIMTNAFEGEIINGGLAQFLWNTFYHYRHVLQDAADGYALVGAPIHAAVVERCIDLCSRFEAGCRSAVEAAMRDQSGSHFVRWYAKAEREMMFPEEELFGSSSDIMQTKGQWILGHLDEYKKLIEKRSPTTPRSVRR